jgi:hypothetical protein
MGVKSLTTEYLGKWKHAVKEGLIINNKTVVVNGTTAWLSPGTLSTQWGMLSRGERLIKLRPNPTDPRSN